MKNLINNLKIFIFLVFITGVIYPLVMTLIGQTIFSDKVNGSLVLKDGKVIGSELIAQEFKDPKYFWPRPSAVNYDPSLSGASNLSPDSKSLREAIEKRAVENHLNVNSHDDLLFASGSGLDPHVSPDSALRQVVRVSGARKFTAEQSEQLRILVLNNIEGRQLGVLGRERVNVLKLNLLLDKNF